jgi:hypothetical protein
VLEDDGTEILKYMSFEGDGAKYVVGDGAKYVVGDGAKYVVGDGVKCIDDDGAKCIDDDGAKCVDDDGVGIIDVSLLNGDGELNGDGDETGTDSFPYVVLLYDGDDEYDGDGDDEYDGDGDGEYDDIFDELLVLDELLINFILKKKHIHYIKK